MMKTSRRLGIFLLVLCLAGISRAAEEAKPFLHPLFASEMVLQRDAQDPIWGWTEPGKQVTVSMNGKSATTTADKDGKWMAKLGPFEAGGPFELTVSGPQEVKLTNVMVGDVWICSGQSNMEMSVPNCYDREHEIAAANYPNIRLFTVPHQIAYEPKTGFGVNPKQPDEAKWLVCTPQNIMVGEWGGFSAVAYFFGRDLHEHLKVPIGLICTSWGGTIAEAWTSGSALKQMSDFQDVDEKVQQAKSRQNTSSGRPASNPNVPTVLYNGMIAPLEPLAIKGATWYQGEANAARAMQYRTLLPTMIRDWRSRFTGGDFPFFIVQLASFMAVDANPNGPQQWPELREAQALTAHTVGNSALTLAIDIGNTADIHPKNKQEVGARLALNARAIAYGEKIEYSGPVYRDMEVKENRIVLHFDHAKGGLVGGGVHSFAIAGEDKNFVWATATIQGDSVVVFSPKVDHPVAVRYAWANNPDQANLYNKAGLPAVPFRTDMPK